MYYYCNQYTITYHLNNKLYYIRISFYREILSLLILLHDRVISNHFFSLIVSIYYYTIPIGFIKKTT